MAEEATVLLYADESPAAEGLRRLLRRAHLSFEVVPTSGYSAPALGYAGLTYHTIEGMWSLIRDLAPNPLDDDDVASLYYR